MPSAGRQGERVAVCRGQRAATILGLVLDLTREDDTEVAVLAPLSPMGSRRILDQGQR
jgi:hypothetical protein